MKPFSSYDFAECWHRSKAVMQQDAAMIANNHEFTKQARLLLGAVDFSIKNNKANNGAVLIGDSLAQEIKSFVDKWSIS